MKTRTAKNLQSRRLRQALFLTPLCIAAGANADQPSASALANLSIEQLMNESVTSVAKKETKLSESPTAITLITQEDIRRSGLTTLPELLRMVPGLDVARINANEWAVGSRGFNHQFGRKLLVLMDGRTLYTPTTASVAWNAQDVVLEDLDRIEVIRGPGATLWGANAVNGVINIVSKKARDTQGTLITTAAGTEEQPMSAIRYGGQIGSTAYYRVFVTHYEREGLVNPGGQRTGADDWNSSHAGFRVDWEPVAGNELTIQGDYYIGEAGEHISATSLLPPFASESDVINKNSGGNLLGRWTRTFTERSQLTLQAYYDHVQQDNGFTREYRDTNDLDLQHRFGLGARNDLVWGGGIRYTAIENTSPPFQLTWSPSERELHLYNFFVQDEITLLPDILTFTIGSKFEHNNFTGLEVQPSARLLWKATEKQTFWTAVSRATRTPSLFEQDLRYNAVATPTGPGGPTALVSTFGNPQAESEKLISFEIGYRVNPSEKLSLDFTAFANIYDELIAFEQGSPGFEFSPAPPHVLIPYTVQNSHKGETVGTEISALWQVTDIWRLRASYSLLKMNIYPRPDLEDESPQQQFQVHSHLDLPANLWLDANAYWVDQIHTTSVFTRLPVDSYLRLDVGFGWRPNRNFELGIWGQNLLDNQHPEFGSVKNPSLSEVPRGVVGKVTIRF